MTGDLITALDKIGEVAEKIKDVESDKLDTILSALNYREPRLLSKKEAAAYLGISTKTLDNMTTGRVKAKGPKQIQIQDRILYDRKDLDAYINNLPRRGGRVA